MQSVHSVLFDCWLRDNPRHTTESFAAPNIINFGLFSHIDTIKLVYIICIAARYYLPTGNWDSFHRLHWRSKFWLYISSVVRCNIINWKCGGQVGVPLIYVIFSFRPDPTESLEKRIHFPFFSWSRPGIPWIGWGFRGDGDYSLGEMRGGRALKYCSL